jgi:hypothetical protein
MKSSRKRAFMPSRFVGFQVPPDVWLRTEAGDKQERRNEEHRKDPTKDRTFSRATKHATVTQRANPVTSQTNLIGSTASNSTSFTNTEPHSTKQRPRQTIIQVAV